MFGSDSDDSIDKLQLGTMASQLREWGGDNKLKLIGIVLLAVFVWVFRPWFQPIWYALAFKYIGTTVYLILTVIVGFGALASQNQKVTAVLGVLAILLAFITFISPIVAGAYVKEDLSERTTSTIEKKQFSNARSVDTQNIRVITIKGAETQARTSFNKPTHTLSRGELIKRNGTLTVSYAQVPEGLYKSLVKKQEGAVFVTINSTESKVSAVNTKFECGRGMLIFDDVHFKIQKNHMNTKLTNPTTFQGNDGELYNMYTGVKREIRFGIENGIPMLYSVPKVKTVHLSDTECNRETLTLKEALNDPRMTGESLQQFYPYSLSRKEVIATNFKHGWLNTITNKRDMKEFPRTKAIDNRPPYTLVFEDGSYGQVLTMEAIGDGTGVFEVYVVNGRTGEKHKFTFERPRKGPGYAADKVVTNDAEKFGQTSGDGEESSSSNKLTVSEIYPVFRNGELWYQVNVVQSSTGVYGYTAFYHPESDTLLKAFTDKQIKAFYNGSNATHTRTDKVVKAPDTEQPTRTVENPELWVVIKDENGDQVRTIPIGGNETVTINQNDPSDNDTADNSTETGG